MRDVVAVMVPGKDRRAGGGCGAVHRATAPLFGSSDIGDPDTGPREPEGGGAGPGRCTQPGPYADRLSLSPALPLRRGDMPGTGAAITRGGNRTLCGLPLPGCSTGSLIFPVARARSTIRSTRPAR